MSSGPPVKGEEKNKYGGPQWGVAGTVENGKAQPARQPMLCVEMHVLGCHNL